MASASQIAVAAFFILTRHGRALLANGEHRSEKP
jgi:hypothetical protein